MRLRNLENDVRKYVNNLGHYHVLEYMRDASVAPEMAQMEYYMHQMGVRRRQLVVDLTGNNSTIIQSGGMQWFAGDVRATTGLKGVGDLLGKVVKGSMTKESAVKPEYVGEGILVLEPTYKYIILLDVSKWGKGVTIENGMFMACDGTVKTKLVSRKNISSTVFGKEGFFNLSLQGSGIAALESNVPLEELVEIDLEDEELKIDGNLAVCWSSELSFTVERSSRTLIGSAVGGEGLVNVYRGTGKVLMSTVAPSTSLFAATHSLKAKAGSESVEPLPQDPCNEQQ